MVSELCPNSLVPKRRNFSFTNVESSTAKALSQCLSRATFHLSWNWYHQRRKNVLPNPLKKSTWDISTRFKGWRSLGWVSPHLSQPRLCSPMSSTTLPMGSAVLWADLREQLPTSAGKGLRSCPPHSHFGAQPLLPWAGFGVCQTPWWANGPRGVS